MPESQGVGGVWVQESQGVGMFGFEVFESQGVGVLRCLGFRGVIFLGGFRISWSRFAIVSAEKSTVCRGCQGVTRCQEC